MSASAAAARALGASLGVLFLCAGSARADVVDLTVSTLLYGHADARDGQLHTVVPVYESLSALLTIQRPYTDGIRIVFSGWGAMVLDIPREQRWDGDIDAGYIEGGFGRGRLFVRLGRQLVTGGAARITQLDGLSASVRLLRGLRLSGYGGVPVTPRFGVSRGEAVFGGRLSYRYSVDTEVGISFNQVLAEGRVARQDLGLDARYAPHRRVTLTGYALLSIPEARLAEADVAVVVQPHARVELAADYRRTSPDLFLPRTSIFAVFSQETRDEAGGSLYVRPVARLRLTADYRAILNGEGLGHRGGGKASVSLGRRDHTTLAGEVRVLRLPSNGYVQARLYSLHRLSSALTAALNADAYFLDHPLGGLGNQQTYSLTATGTLGWELGSGFRLVATAIADVTPLVERRLECVFRLAYNATRRFHEVHP